MICAIVLAAGRSVRMGQQKLLLPVGGKPMIAGIVQGVLRSPVANATVVLGCDADSVRTAIQAGISEAQYPSPPVEEGAEERRQFPRLTFVNNPDPAGDMLSSIRCGVRALPEACDAVLIVLGDQPGVTARVIEQLILANASSKRPIVVPVYKSKRGHPLLFSGKLREEVLNKYDGLGLHAMLDAHANDIAEVEVGSEHNLEDVDTPDDYRRYVGMRD